jgi:TRAP-type C4-dicarboxylate transport system substrate-binding protein
VCVLCLPGAAAEKTYKWKFLAVAPDAHPNGKILIEAFKRIEERTGGRLKIQYVNFMQTPYKADEALRTVRDGLAEGVSMLCGYNTVDAPLLGAVELPFLLPNYEKDYHRFYATVETAWEHPVVGRMVQKVWDQFHAVPVGRIDWGVNEIFARSEVRNPAGLKGKQLREYSAEGADTLKALGGSAVVMTGAEVYTSLQRGVTDGFISSCQSAQMLKWFEVVKSLYVVHWKGGSSFFLYNKEKMNSLPPDFQKILAEEHQAASKAINEFTAQYIPKCESFMAGQEGWSVTYPTQEEYTLLRNIAKKDSWPKWIERVGPAGKEMLNACLEAVKDPDKF